MGNFDKGFLTGMKSKEIRLGGKGGFTAGLREKPKKITGLTGVSRKSRKSKGRWTGESKNQYLFDASKFII